MKTYIKYLLRDGTVMYVSPDGWIFPADTNNPRYVVMQAEILATTATEDEIDLALA